MCPELNTAVADAPVATKAPAKATKSTSVKKSTLKKKVQQAKPSANGKSAKKEAAPRAKGSLTGNQLKVLAALKGTSHGGKELDRQELAKKTGINKGWSKMLGSATIDGFGSGSDGLEPLGYVKSAKREDSRRMTYSITAKGTKALADAS